MSENAANVVDDSRTTATGVPSTVTVATPPTGVSSGCDDSVSVVLVIDAGAVALPDKPHAASAMAASAAAPWARNVRRAHAPQACYCSSFTNASSELSECVVPQFFQNHIIAPPTVLSAMEPSATFRCRRAFAFDRFASPA